MNPYSYIMNNPLGGVDPTGYMAEKEVSVRRPGSRIKQKVKVSASNAGGSTTITFTSNNGAAPGAVADRIQSTLKGAGIEVENIKGGVDGSDARISELFGAGVNGNTLRADAGGDSNGWFDSILQGTAGLAPLGDAGFELVVNGDAGAAAKSASLEVGIDRGRGCGGRSLWWRRCCTRSTYWKRVGQGDT